MVKLNWYCWKELTLHARLVEVEKGVTKQQKWMIKPLDKTLNFFQLFLSCSVCLLPESGFKNELKLNLFHFWAAYLLCSNVIIWYNPTVQYCMRDNDRRSRAFSICSCYKNLNPWVVEGNLMNGRHPYCFIVFSLLLIPEIPLLWTY